MAEYSVCLARAHAKKIIVGGVIIIIILDPVPGDEVLIPAACCL